MKRILTASLFALSLVASSAWADDLTGVITCSKCKKTGAAAADCAKTCIKNGVAPIFISADGKTYKIANPDKVGNNVNEKIKVSGTVKKDMLTIDSISAA